MSAGNLDTWKTQSFGCISAREDERGMWIQGNNFFGNSLQGKQLQATSCPMRVNEIITEVLGK